jgi:NAD(P)-dependent dehydrogenase (short-subunit alcohol dehydrogenase family)
MRVVVTSRSDERARATADALGEGAVGVGVELTDPGAPEALVERALAQLGRLDVLVNNAGAGQVADSATLELAEWQRIIDLDLTAGSSSTSRRCWATSGSRGERPTRRPSTGSRD